MPSSILLRSKKRSGSVIPPDEIKLILDNIGLPNGGINLAFTDSAVISDSDGDILISLKPGKRHTQLYMRELRADLHAEVSRRRRSSSRRRTSPIRFLTSVCRRRSICRSRGAARTTTSSRSSCLKQVQAIPGIADAHIHQQVAQPTIDVNVDRLKSRQIGLTQQDVAQSMLISLTGTGQTAPNEWLNPQNGVNYQVVVQTPHLPHRLAAVAGRARRLLRPRATPASCWATWPTFERDTTPVIINHYNIQPVYDIYADTDQRDLGGVASEIRKIMDATESKLPVGTTLALRGEVTDHDATRSRGWASASSSPSSWSTC